MDITEMPARRTVVLNIPPMAKPRMTRKDTWKPKPVVVKYRLWKDDLRLRLKEAGIDKFPEQGAHITFYIPMPKSWSMKKQVEFLSTPHKARPDVDNLLKGLMDGVFDGRGDEERDDCEVWDIHVTKKWTSAFAGRIEILYDI